MNDPFFVGRRQSVRDLQRVIQSLAHRDRSAAQTLPQRLSLQQFRHHVRRARIRAHLVRANVEYR